MQRRNWQFLASVALATFLTGCGQGGEEAVTASIPGEGGAAKAGKPAAAEDVSDNRYASAGLAKPEGRDPLHPLVVIATSAGVITARLDGERAPGAVTNFVSYANAGHYDGTIFHYVDRASFILGGGYTTQFEAKETSAPIRNEAHNGLKNRRGTLAMSRDPDDIDSATSQFFINAADNETLDFRDESPEGYGYCVFGDVTEGLDVVDKIARAEVQSSGDFPNTPVEPVVIESIRVVK